MARADELQAAIRELLASARQHTLAEMFKLADDAGLQDADWQAWRQRGRDYRSWQRMGAAAPEAIDLASTLARQLPDSLHPLGDTERAAFERQVNDMLVDLYREFLDSKG
ncbi:MAG: hypothetical protein R3217_00380 [Gammaproteobacteria bacterium]|nr:hypothetical protein [Gammaproteobacteria bacterium]